MYLGAPVAAESILVSVYCVDADISWMTVVLQSEMGDNSIDVV